MLPGLITLALLAVVAFGSLGLLVLEAGGLSALPGGRVLPILETTAVQAALSTALSILFGMLLALALMRRHVPGRSLVVGLLAVTSALPAIVIVFGVTDVWGRAGPVNGALAALGFERFSIYGLHGVILAHVLLNAPFAARVYIGAFAAVPGERLRLATNLRLGPLAMFRVVDWPVIRRETPAIAVLVFLLCATSFAIPLTLGGGPGAATLEVAIYEAIRLEADFARAAALALVQVTLLGLVVLATARFLTRPVESPAIGRVLSRSDASSLPLRGLDAIVLAMVVLMLVPPLLAILLGLASLPAVLDGRTATALVTSLTVAAPAAVLALVLALALSGSRLVALRRGMMGGARLLALAPVALVAVPTLVVAAGLFVAARRLGDTGALAVPAMILANALVALPFVHRLVDPPLQDCEARYGRLVMSLRLSGTAWWRVVAWPAVSTSALAALAIATALSLGDLGVAALFGSGAIVTLPLLLAEKLGAYRLGEAQAVAAVLMLVVAGLFLLGQRIGGAGADRA